MVYTMFEIFYENLCRNHVFSLQYSSSQTRNGKQRYAFQNESPDASSFNYEGYKYEISNLLF